MRRERKVETDNRMAGVDLPAEFGPPPAGEGGEWTICQGGLAKTDVVFRW